MVIRSRPGSRASSGTSRAVRPASAGPWPLRLRVAAAGRTRILQDLHIRAHPERPPTPGDDRPKAEEMIINAPTSEECTRMVRYAPVNADDPANGQDPPWRDVLILKADDGTGEVIAPERRLGWCVALHRALVSRIGDGAPAVVTGRYPEGAAVPANRLAIHYLPAPDLARSAAAGPVSAPGAFLVMLPSRVTDDETAVILGALAGMRHLRSRWGRARLQPVGEILDARCFWPGPGPGAARLWSPAPVAVPEVTRQRGSWGFEDAILLSLGFVWRDALSASEGPVPKGAQGYRELVARVRQRGAGVMWYRRHVRHPSAYAHRMPPGMVAQPYTALLSTGELCPDTGLTAIGQSRHLGGGLLVPADLPAELVREGLGGPR